MNRKAIFSAIANVLLHFVVGAMLAYMAITGIAIFGAGYDGTYEELQRDDLLVNTVYVAFIVYQAWSIYCNAFRKIKTAKIENSPDLHQWQSG